MSKRQVVNLATKLYGKQDERVKEIEQLYKSTQEEINDKIGAFIADSRNWDTKAPKADRDLFMNQLQQLIDNSSSDNISMIKTAFKGSKSKTNGDLLLSTVTLALVNMGISQKAHLVKSIDHIQPIAQADTYSQANNLVNKQPNANFDNVRIPNKDINSIIQKTVNNGVMGRNMVDDSFTSINKQTIDTIRKIRDIAEKAAKGYAQAENYKGLVDNVLTGGSKATNGQMGRATGLIRTTTSQAYGRDTLADYQDRGVEQYTFVSMEDDDECNDCGDLDGETFDVDDAEEGVNYPPIHYNCRCTTVEVHKADWDTSDPDVTDELNNL